MPAAGASSLLEERRDDVAILHVPSRLTLGDETQHLPRTVRELAEKGIRRVVLDLSGTAYMDSAGLGALVSAFTAVRSSGGSLALAGPGKRIQDLLQITKLLSVFDVYATVDEAVAAIKQ